MDKELYPPNSHKSKQQEAANERKKPRHTSPIISSEVKTRKKSTWKKMLGVFFAEDINSAKNYVFMDVIVPKLQETVLDILNRGSEYMVYGETKASRIKQQKSNQTFISYNTMSQSTQSRFPSNRMSSVDRKKRYNDFSDLIFEDRGAADLVLSQMYEDLETYGCVTVLSLKEMINLNPVSTDDNYGWVDLSGSSVRRVRGGYLLELPEAVFLD